MRIVVIHFVAAAVFSVIFVFLYSSKNTQLKNYELSVIQRLEFLKTGNRVLNADEYLGVEINKIAIGVQNSGKFEQSALSSGFVSKKRDDGNTTIAKIGASLSKDIFFKLNEYKSFMATSRVEGRDFVVTFAPLGIYGYIVCYRADDTVAKIKREFDGYIFLLIMSALAIKAATMIAAAYMQPKRSRN